jgi:hypothetical protein
VGDGDEALDRPEPNEGTLVVMQRLGSRALSEEQDRSDHLRKSLIGLVRLTTPDHHRARLPWPATASAAAAASFTPMRPSGRRPINGWSFNHAITRLARSTNNGLRDGSCGS